MRPVPRKWAVPLLLLLTAGLVFALHTADSNFDYEKIFSLDGVEMTPQEELDAWLEEQAQAAKEFYGEHEELFHQIAQAALEEEVTAAYSQYLIAPDEEGRPCLVDYRVPGVVGHVSQGYHPPDSADTVSVADLSAELEECLKKLMDLHRNSFEYDDENYEQRLSFGYASTEFPTAIFCDVMICYEEGYSFGGDYDLGDGWFIKSDYLYMYGL